VLVKSDDLSWWEGRKARRLTRSDAAWLAALVALAGAAIVSGAVARRKLSPRTATTVATTLEHARIPARMPDARLRTGQDEHTTLRRIQAMRYVVVTMVNPRDPHLGPFLERMRNAYGDDGTLVVVVPSMATAERTRSALTDAGLSDVEFYRDARNAVVRTGPIDRLPTTFLVAPSGRVLDRVVGTNAQQLARLQLRYRLERELPE
jgi:hypothetical protein